MWLSPPFLSFISLKKKKKRRLKNQQLTLSNQVSTESRYGTNLFLFLPAAWSARAEITSPRVVRDLPREHKQLLMRINIHKSNAYLDSDFLSKNMLWGKKIPSLILIILSSQKLHSHFFQYLFSLNNQVFTTKFVAVAGTKMDFFKDRDLIAISKSIACQKEK